MKTFGLKEYELTSLLIGAIFVFHRFGVVFGFRQYSTPWRERRQEFGIAHVERVPSVLELYEDITSKNAAIDRLKLKIDALQNKLLKCSLHINQIRHHDSWSEDYIIPTIIKGKYKKYADSIKNRLRKYKTWYNGKISKLNPKIKNYEVSETSKLSNLKYLKPPILYPTSLQKIPSVSIKTPNFRIPRPSWTIAKTGTFPQQYPLAEPIPGFIPITPPPIIFPRKIVKIPEIATTTEMSKLEKQKASTIPSIGTTNNKEPSMEAFYIHEALKMNNFSQTTETAFRINPVYIGDKIDDNRNLSVNSNISNFNHDSFDILKEDKPESRKQSRDSLDNLFQPRKLKKLHNLEKGILTKNHYIIQENGVLSLDPNLVPPTIIPPPPSHKTEEVTAEEPEIITAPFPFDNISLNEPAITNSPTPSVITRENKKNFNLNESLVLFNVADNKNSDMENRKYRITNLTHNMPYYTNTTGMRQSRLGNISTLVSGSMLVEER